MASPRSDHRRLLDLADAIITTCANSGLVSRSVYPFTVGPTARAAGLFRPGPLGLLLGERPGRWGPKPLPGGQLAGLTHRVFVGGEVSLDVSFTAAQARLANLIGGGLLVSASAQAYSDGITGLAGVGPLGSALDASRLCQVHFQDLKARDDTARFALRWEVNGPGGGLFPALDADITLTPAGKHSSALTLTGVYRTPLGTVSVELDWVIWHGAATATIEAFLRLLAEALAAPAWAPEPAKPTTRIATRCRPSRGHRKRHGPA